MTQTAQFEVNSTLSQSGTKMCTKKKRAKSDNSQRHFYLSSVKANTGRNASSKDIIHFDSSPSQRDEKHNAAVYLNLQKCNRCQSWCQHKNRKHSQAPPAAGNAANHRVSRAALCLILRCWHLEGNFTLLRCHMVTARRRLGQNFSFLSQRNRFHNLQGINSSSRYWMIIMC